MCASTIDIGSIKMAREGWISPLSKSILGDWNSLRIYVSIRAFFRALLAYILMAGEEYWFEIMVRSSPSIYQTM
jgi:hypothetical protein